MPSDLTSLLVLGATSICTFALARYLSRSWRARRRRKDEAARQAGESRQVRRARERQGRR